MTDKAKGSIAHSSTTPQKCFTRRNLAAAAAALVAGVASSSSSVLALTPRRRRPRHPHHCFLAGTRIATPLGDVAIENLAVGDMVLTASGGAKPILGIGRRSVRFEASGRQAGDLLPVLIKRSAIDATVPSRDLWVTGGHALCIDGLLIPAHRLVNGVTIVRQAPAGAQAMVFLHVDLGSHDVVIAEGLACESLNNTGPAVVAGFDTFDTAVGVAAVAAGPAAQVVPDGHRAELASRLRSATSMLIDRRTGYDRARDRIEQRAVCTTI